nr:PREDICTED: NLR family member X1 isoform X1 [Lepisosteus oculatus]XP_015192963.1 PREDICTED: NLR family member X1 isoform X1 [Lepisosteus oculatus]
MPEFCSRCSKEMLHFLLHLTQGGGSSELSGTLQRWWRAPGPEMMRSWGRGWQDILYRDHVSFWGRGVKVSSRSSKVYILIDGRHVSTIHHRHLCPAGGQWSRQRDSPSFLTSVSQMRPFSSGTSNPDPILLHKQKLTQWFSHLPKEEKQFGVLFSPESMHVDPLILERNPKESQNVDTWMKDVGVNDYQSSLTTEQLFDPVPGSYTDRGHNVVLYGSVGTGKSMVVRKLVLDWCRGSALSQFELVIPFSCEDLSLLGRPASLRQLVRRKYLHLRDTPLLSGEGALARQVLFIFNGMEQMKLDFRLSTTELCADPDEPLPAGTILVNLFRKYLLPEASILVTTRLSALDRIPGKYVNRYVQICGFNNPDQQRAYFTSRLLHHASGEQPSQEAEALLRMLYLNLQSESQLAAACFLPSYCWLTCATLHFLHFTDAKAPIRTLTGIYTSFLRLNFGGEVLEASSRLGGAGGSEDQQGSSLMYYVAQTVGKLAFDGVNYKRTCFSEEELEQWIGGKTKTDEELRQLAVFQTDVLDFFLVPYVGSSRPGEDVGETRYVFAIPAMQEYLAALYVVLGENKTVLEKLGKQASEAIGQASEDLTSLLNILSKFLPLRIFAIFNLLKMFPSLYRRVSGHGKGRIARTMAAEMFRKEDQFNADVLDQVEQSVLGVQGPLPQERQEKEAFELYPVFMGGLLSYGNRVLLDQLGCTIKSTAVAQITSTLKKNLVKESQKHQPPEEMMDLLFFLYEFQNPRFTAEVLGSLKAISLARVRMTPLKCYVLRCVLSCAPSKHLLKELDLSSCHLTKDLLETLGPSLLRARSLNLQFNNLGPDACPQLKELLLDSRCQIRTLRLCDNSLLEPGVSCLLEALSENRSLRHLSLMHTGMGDGGARELAARLRDNKGLEELNVAYNAIGDSAAVQLVDTCREHPTINTVHLYLNQLSEAGKQSLHARAQRGEGPSRRVKVLASVTEGGELSEDWHPILGIIRQNCTSWERPRVREQLLLFLRDLEGGRRQTRSLAKKLYFRRVERDVKQTLRMLERGAP